LGIDQIFAAAGSFFVAEQFLQSNEPHFLAQIVSFYCRFAAFIKGHAIDASEDLDLSRFPSDFDDERGLEEILFFNAGLAETEFLEDFHQKLGVRLA
jgi:hypothetical protein